jgi:SAM-dependent methyltransferase
LSCRNKYIQENNKVFFIESPKDARRLNDDNPNVKPRSEERKKEYQYFAGYLEKENDKKVFCDLGPGTAPYHELTDKFYKYLGVDMFPYKHVNIVADLNQPLPLRDNSCDIIFITNVLEHIALPESLFREIFRILRPGGYCLGSAPFLHPTHYHPYDFYRYTVFALRRFVHLNGFKNIEIKPIGQPVLIYKRFNEYFFNTYLDAKFTDNKFSDFLIKIIVRLMRKINFIFLKISTPLHKKIQDSDDWALAYCFKIDK